MSPRTWRKRRVSEQRPLLRPLPWHGLGHRLSWGRAGPAWSWRAATVSQQPCPTARQPSWPGVLPALSPRHGPRPAEPPSLVLVVQEVFLPQVLVDPAGSEDGCGEAVLADQAQGLQRQAVSSMGQARRSPCHLPCPHSPKSHWPHGGAGHHHGHVLWHLPLQGPQHQHPPASSPCMAGSPAALGSPLLTAVSPG